MAQPNILVTLTKTIMGIDPDDRKFDILKVTTVI